MTSDPNHAEEKSEAGTQTTFLHWASGAAILALDWLLFSGNILSGGLGMAALAAIGFVAGGTLTAAIQRFAARDTALKSLAKGVLGGLVVGIPTPLAGTAVGGFVVGLSGLKRIQRITKLAP